MGPGHGYTAPWLQQVVGRDFEFVTVGAAEIDRVRDFVVLELEAHAATLQFVLGGEKAFSISAKRQMQHVDIIWLAHLRCRESSRETR